jgi:hypothetical protein
VSLWKEGSHWLLSLLLLVAQDLILESYCEVVGSFCYRTLQGASLWFFCQSYF